MNRDPQTRKVVDGGRGPRPAPARPVSAALLCVGLAIIASLACGRSPRPSAPASARDTSQSVQDTAAPADAPADGPPPAGHSPTPALSASGPDAPSAPRATLERLIALRSESKYRELVPWLAPPSGAAVAEVLRAVDEFLAANRRLCTWVRDRVGIGLAEAIDQGYIADELSTYLGGSMSLFGRAVVLLDETVDGDVARVSFTVGGRLPAEQALLRRHAGLWRYDPQATLNPLVNEAFLDMARALDALRSELEAGRPPPEELRRNRDKLMDKVQARLRRGVSLLNKAQAGGRPPDAPG